MFSQDNNDCNLMKLFLAFCTNLLILLSRHLFEIKKLTWELLLSANL